jgi:hypothetical protein
MGKRAVLTQKAMATGRGGDPFATRPRAISAGAIE